MSQPPKERSAGTVRRKVPNLASSAVQVPAVDYQAQVYAHPNHHVDDT